MAEQLWGTYSVADHCEPYAFIADLILYDRLLVPVPPSDDSHEWDRWATNEWRPERQKLLLKELGDYVKPIGWTKELRARWEAMEDVAEEADTAAFAGDDLEWTAEGAREVKKGRPDPFGDTRRLLARDLGAKLLQGADARVLSVYARPDRFDRHWRVTKTFPFLKRGTTVERAEKPRAVEELSPEQQQSLVSQGQLATMIVGEFVLPVDDASPRKPDDDQDHKALVSALKLLDDENVYEKRRALHAWIAKYDAKQIPAPAKVEEFDDLLLAYNAAVSKKKKLKWINTGLLVLRPFTAGASLVAPGASHAATAAEGAIGSAATRYFSPGEWEPEDIRAAALISEARKAIGKSTSERRA